MNHKLFVIGIIVGVTIIVGLYYSFDPIFAEWMPKCPFNMLTGLNCPACGNQRALHALLHGNIATAFAYNPFFLVSMPYLVLLVVSCRCRTGKLGKLRNVVQHRIVVNLYVIAICGWWILRNVLSL